MRTATSSAMKVSPVWVMTPGPEIEIPGERPMLPVMVMGPVLVISEPARMAKLGNSCASAASANAKTESGSRAVATVLSRIFLYRSEIMAEPRFGAKSRSCIFLLLSEAENRSEGLFTIVFILKILP